MGQQQIILILLVTVVVALATVMAINTMQDSHTQSNHEAIKQKMMDATTLAQSYYRKNKALGGGGLSYQNITLDDLNITPNNELGEFSITEKVEDSFVLLAIPAAGDEINISATIFKDHIEITEVSKE